MRTAPASPHPTALVTTTSIASSAPSPNAPNPHRTVLGSPNAEALPVELLPMAGGTRVLAVAQTGERATWARTIDASGAFGKVRRFVDANVVTAFEASDGRTTFVTSDGDRLCATTYAADADSAGATGCEAVRPEMVVPIGDRAALVSLDIAETAVRVSLKTKTSGGKSGKKPAEKRTDTKVGGAKGGKPGAAKKSGATKATSKKKETKKRKASETVLVPAAKAKASVRVTWLSREGVIDPQSVATGLSFERPLAGMTLVDVVPRGAGADVLFYEAVGKPAHPSKTKYGTARLGIASLGADGKLVETSRARLGEGDLEYGYVSGQNAPRLVVGAAGTVLVSFAGRGGTCRAERALPVPALGPAAMAKAACLVDPAGAPSVAAERLLAAEPRRAPGQTKTDAPLVVWAGDLAMFSGSTGFGAASRSDGAPKATPAPFEAKRARVAWSAFAPDGEGIALAAGKLFAIDVAGTVSEAASSEVIDALGLRAAEAVRGRADAAAERRRAARIGDGWWLARGEVVRLVPKPMKLDALSGRAHPDATALTGGRERGMFLEVAGVLRTTFIAKDGAVSAGPVVSSPVRAGFDATERAAGGAIVAGVSAQDPTKVVSFVIDADGKLGAPQPTSLALAPGTFAVRLSALPSGGALLTDLERNRMVWLGDDARELGSAKAPPDDWSNAVCVDGQPARATVPSTEPGKLVRVAELATAGTCISGDIAWTAGGALRWFGSSVRGLDSLAEVASVPGAAGIATLPVVAAGVTPALAAVQAPVQASGGTGISTGTGTSAPKAACPTDMVAVAGRFCIDRFEATLVDARTRRVLSPDYPPTPNLLEIVLGDWSTDRAHWGDVHARAFPLPPVPTWQRGSKTEPVAEARFGARANGYVTGLVAEAACTAAGKRLCVLDEFTTACRGEADTDFPYGSDYQDGVCNVYREEHPAALLHHNASLGHLDPRLNRVRARGKPLFETAGARPACRSTWGSDTVYDLVGNLDEWVDEGGGAFAGGFYARSTRSGCDAVITAHPKVYADYSTGVRCCKDAEK